MATPRFPQRRDFDLFEWSGGFRDKIVADPGHFNLSQAQAEAYSELHDAFAAAYAVAYSPTGNSKAGVSAKNQTRKRLLNSSGGAWELVNFIQAHPETTDFMRSELGLRLPKKPVPVSAPRSAPAMSILSTVGRIVKVRLRDMDHPDSRGKPPGVRGATVLYCFGDVPDGGHADRSQWLFVANVSKPMFDVAIPSCVPAGSNVWLTAFWFNDKMESGPTALAQQVCAGVAGQKAEELALAA